MKVVGLLSGGKDSCFNLCHCVKQGHQIVALASLRPEGGKEEIDSYLYQTVGQDGLHFIAEAFELPLYRHTIKGTAVDQAGDYASTSEARIQGRVEGDETEDLYDLLKEVLVAHPDVQGVSVGAILSNYQRVRVEHVCARLGLQSLSYLWQYDQSQLLDDMAEAGMECIIIKVAGAGLGLRHLGQNVCSPQMRATLEALKNKWGTHPAGEGGEYETFTINCPLFKRRIALMRTEQVVLSSSDPRYDIGTVAYLRIQEAELVQRTHTETGLSALRTPSLLAEDMQELYDLLESHNGKNNGEAVSLEHARDPDIVFAEPQANAGSAGPWLTVGNLISRRASPAEQAEECFLTLKERLAEQKMNLQDIAHINLYLSSMDLFGPINLVYNSFFGPSPPTRACISSILAKDFYVKMDVLAYREESAEPRSALHVRSLSYWAPANIGPYSQAVRVGERLFVAGQIGLIPPSLTLPQPMSLAMEAALSLQHESRIVKAVQEGTGGGFQVAVDSCICWVSGPPNTFQSKLFAARLAWSKWLRIQQYGKDTQVPFLIIQVPGLPKGAQIEWQMTWRAGQSIKDTEDDETPASIKTSLLLFENAGETTLPPQAGTAFSVRIFHKMTVAPDAGVSVYNLATDKIEAADVAVMALDYKV